MSNLLLYTDEDVSGRLARALNAQGLDILSCHQAGNSGRGHSDEWQLQFAVMQERAILTHNVGDYSVLASRWAIEGRTPFGIVLAHRVPIALLISKTARFVTAFDVDNIVNATVWLP